MGPRGHCSQKNEPGQGKGMYVYKIIDGAVACRVGFLSRDHRTETFNGETAIVVELFKDSFSTKIQHANRGIRGMASFIVQRWDAEANPEEESLAGIIRDDLDRSKPSKPSDGGIAWALNRLSLADTFGESNVPVLDRDQQTRWFCVAINVFVSSLGSCTSSRPNPKHVNVLHGILQERLKTHMIRTVQSKAHRNHPVWRFVRDNLRRVASAMILVGHVKPQTELERAEAGDEGYCLLAEDRERFLRLNGPLDDKLQGCYLMHHPDFGFICSGGVVNGPFANKLRSYRTNGFVAMSTPHGGSKKVSLKDVEFSAGLAFYLDCPYRKYNRLWDDNRPHVHGPNDTLLATESGLFVWPADVNDHTKRQYLIFLLQSAYALSLSVQCFSYDPLGFFAKA